MRIPRRALIVLALIGCAASLRAVAPAAESAPATESAPASADLAAARALFERNLDAIRHRDREAYLACYLESETLALNGVGGLNLGYEALAKNAGSGWPDVFDGQDLQLVPLAPGIVYASYRYRVRYGEVEQTGRSERVFRSTPEGWRIAVSTAFSDSPGTSAPPRALVGGTLIDGTGEPATPDSVVVLRDGKIQCAGSRAACPVPADAGVVDVKGTWITPGLIDAHVHFSQTGWVDGRPDALDLRVRHPYEQVEADLRAHPERFWRADLCSGVTAVLDAGGYPWSLGLEERAENDTRAPHVAAAGPLLSTVDHWLNLPAERQFTYLHDEASAQAAVASLKASGARFVKVWFIVDNDAEVAKLEPLVRAAGDAARAAGLPLIVHATGLAQAKGALRAGAHLLVHSVWEQPIDQEFLDLAKTSGAIYCPTLTVESGYLRLFKAIAAGKAPEIDDPGHCVDAQTRAHVAESATLGADILKGRDLAVAAKRSAEHSRWAAENLMRVQAAGIPIAMGTDAGNPLTFQGPSVYAEMEAMQAAGLSPKQVLLAATRGGAKAMGREKDLGTLEAGKQADLLVLDADPLLDIKALRRLRYVVRGGEVRPAAELRAADAPAARPKP